MCSNRAHYLIQFLFVFRMENTVALLKMLQAKRKHRTLFKFKFENNVRAFQVFLRLKSHHQLLYPRKLMMINQPLAKERDNHVKRKMLHHPEVEDAMLQLHHLIQSSNYFSLLSSLIVLYQWEEKLKYHAMFKDQIHKHVGIKVKV